MESSKAATPCSTTLISAIGLGTNFAGNRPLLTGHVSCTRNHDQVLFVGGGATCFSFGTFWTEGTWVLQPRDCKEQNKWEIVEPQPAAPSRPIPRPSDKPDVSARTKETVAIPRVQIASAPQFQQVIANGKPVILEGSDLGHCTERWTKEYLTKAVGEERKVRQPSASHNSSAD